MSIGVRHANLHEARESSAVVVSRVDGPVLTHDLEFVWPEVATRLRAMLRRRGVQHHDIDEIVQETATRAISIGIPYDDADDLFRWAAVVGGRLAIDIRRRGARLSDEDVPDRADTIDVAAAAEHRVVLSVVRNRLPELSARDQAALLSGFRDEPAPGRRESVRAAVARHRARNRLRLLLDGLVGGAILGWARRNRVWSAPIEAISYAAAPTAACLLITISAWGGLVGSRYDEPAPQPTPVRYVEPVTAASHPSEATTSEAPPPPGGDASQSTPRSPSVAPLPDAHVVISDPAGDGTTRVDVRDKEPTDHLWCLDPPPETGQTSRCFDSPVTLPSAP